MAFNRKGFIAAAKAKQIPDEDINSYLESQGVKSLTKGEKFLYGAAMPTIGAGLGLAGGGMLAAGSLGLASPTIPFGGMAGAGAGTALQQALKNVLGYQDQGSLEQAQGVASNAMLGGVVGSVPGVVSTLLNPLGTVKNISGTVRNKSIGNAGLNTEEAKAASMEKLKASDWYQTAPEGSALMGESRLNEYWNKANPPITSNPGSISGFATGKSSISQKDLVKITDLYKKLVPFETQAKAYMSSGQPGSTEIAQGTNLASHAIRDYLNTQIPKTAQVANQVYSGASKIPAKWNASPLGALGSYFIGRYLFNALNKTGGQ